MKNNKYFWPLLTIVLVFFAMGIFKLINTKKKMSSEKTDKNQIVIEANKSDKAALEDFLKESQVPENQIYGAMIRQGQDGDSVALEVAKKLVASPSKYLREGAAQTLGYFADEKILSELSTLSKDAEESVRIFALESLATLKSAAREKVAEDKIQDQKMTASEKITLLGSLYKLRTDNEKQKKDLEQIIALAKQKDTEIAKVATIKAMQISADNKLVKDLMVEKIKNSKDDNLRGVAIRTLANSNDGWLKEHLAELSQNAGAGVRIASIQSVHRLCPENKWMVLENVILKDKEESVVNHALEELLFLEKAKAMMLLAKVSKNNSLADYRKQSVEKFLESLRNKPDVNVCK